MHEIIGQLKERFPIITRLRVAPADCPTGTEPLPLYMGILLAAMHSENRAPCCFVLPRRGRSAHLAAVVFGLTKFIEDYERLDRLIAETAFKPGQNVFVRPPNKIYRYRGVHAPNPSWIELGTLDGSGWQTFPLSDVRRLEVTSAIKPAGNLGQIPRIVPHTQLDYLMGVNTVGNLSAFLNHVLLLDYKTDFEEVANGISFQNNVSVPGMPPLSGLIPLGAIAEPDEEGNVKLKKWNFPTSRCEPLIAVSSSPEKIVAACKAAPPRSKVVVVNGLGFLASHIQAYDEIAEAQRLVIVAEHEDQEQMQALADRGCKFWWLGDREISMGLDVEAPAAASRSVFGPVFRSARNESQMEVEFEVCEGQALDDIAVALVTLDEAVQNDTTGTTRSLVSRAYKLLNNLAGLVQPPTQDESRRFADQLAVISRELERDRHWIGKPAETLAQICRLFNSALSGNFHLGESKGVSLLKVFRAMYGETDQQTAILARNNSQVKQLEGWSRRFGFGAKVFTPGTVPEDAGFGCIVCVAWPGGDAFQRMVRRFLAPRIKVIGYAFENSWLRQCHRKLRQRPQLPAFSQSEKSAMIQSKEAARAVWPEESSAEEQEPKPQLATPFSIWAFENRLRSVRKGGTAAPLTVEESVAAKYLGFRGASYAHITEGHKLPIVTELLAAKPGARQKTPMKEISQVKVGDFAVFRDGGSRDVIQVIADQQIQRNGQDPTALRQRANLWVNALRDTGLSPDEILSELNMIGPGKTLPTIRNWLHNDSIIGPGLRSDLDSIAKLTKSRELEDAKEDIWAAIKQIRGAHLGAGMWLTGVLLQKLPSCLGEIEENGTKINIEDVVTAWVVQVEDIAPQFEQFPRSSINRLLWDRPAATSALYL